MDKYDLQPAKNELLDAIAYFVRRQELVAQVIKDLGLDLHVIATLGAGGWTLSAENAKQLLDLPSSSYSDKFRNAFKTLVENNTPKINQSGVWIDKKGENWNYFLHGGGCRLVNQNTAEPIDWDCPSTEYFDSFKFDFHLEWQIEKFPNKFPNLARYRSEHGIDAVEQELIPEIVKDGKLTKDGTNLYRTI